MPLPHGGAPAALDRVACYQSVPRHICQCSATNQQAGPRRNPNRVRTLLPGQTWYTRLRSTLSAASMSPMVSACVPPAPTLGRDQTTVRLKSTPHCNGYDAWRPTYDSAGAAVTHARYVKLTCGGGSTRLGYAASCCCVVGSAHSPMDVRCLVTRVMGRLNGW